jgi:hypothetical protein
VREEIRSTGTKKRTIEKEHTDCRDKDCQTSASYMRNSYGNFAPHDRILPVVFWLWDLVGKMLSRQREQ